LPRSEQTIVPVYEPRDATAVVHKPHPHDSARLHVSGAAAYIDDIREPQGALHIAVGMADKAHGNLRGLDLAAVREAARDEVFLPGADRNPLAIDDERIAALDHHHVLVAGVRVGHGGRALTAAPEGHLAAVDAVEDKALDARRCLAGSCNLVGGLPHECGKFLHR